MTFRNMIIAAVMISGGLTGRALSQTLALDEKLSTKVEGTVTDTNGIPIPGYPVIISRETDKANIVVFTGKDGGYLIEGLAAGNYVAIPGTDTTAQAQFSIETAATRSWNRKEPGEVVEVPQFAVPTGRIQN